MSTPTRKRTIVTFTNETFTNETPWDFREVEEYAKNPTSMDFYVPNPWPSNVNYGNR